MLKGEEKTEVIGDKAVHLKLHECFGLILLFACWLDELKGGPNVRIKQHKIIKSI